MKILILEREGNGEGRVTGNNSKLGECSPPIMNSNGEKEACRLPLGHEYFVFIVSHHLLPNVFGDQNQISGIVWKYYSE